MASEDVLERARDYTVTMGDHWKNGEVHDLVCDLAAEVRDGRERIATLEEFLTYLREPMLAARRMIVPGPLDRPQNVHVEWRTGADTVVRYFELIAAAMASRGEDA